MEPKQVIIQEIERLEHEAKRIQRNAAAFAHWNNNSIFRQSSIQPVDVSGRIKQIYDRIRELEADLAGMED